MSVEVMGGGSANLQSKSIIPPSLPYTANPDSGYDGFSSLTMQKPSTLIASNIKSGVSIFGVSGTYAGASGFAIERIVQSSPSGFTQDSITISVPTSAKALTGISFYFSDANGDYTNPVNQASIACAVFVLDSAIQVGETKTISKAYEVYGGSGSNSGFSLFMLDGCSITFTSGYIVINVSGAGFGRGYYTFALGLG